MDRKEVLLIVSILNKNDNIHKNKLQQIRWSDEYWQYTLGANIILYQRLLDSEGLTTLQTISTWKVSWVFQQLTT